MIYTRVPYIVGKCVVQVCVLSKTSKVGLKPTSLLHVNSPLAYYIKALLYMLSLDKYNTIDLVFLTLYQGHLPCDHGFLSLWCV